MTDFKEAFPFQNSTMACKRNVFQAIAAFVGMWLLKLLKALFCWYSYKCLL